MNFYAFYYISVILLLGTDYFFKNIKFFLYIALMLVIFISGTRYETGYDFHNYHYFYINHEDELSEPLFNLSLHVLNLFSSDSQLVFFIYSMFTISIAYIAIGKYTKYIKTSFLIYLLIPGLYLNTFSILRQGIAESILLLAFFYFIYKKNYTISLVLSVVAFLFHYSSILPMLILIMFYPLMKRSYSMFVYTILVSMSIVLYKINLAMILLGLASGRYAEYLDFIYHVSMIKLIVLNSFAFVLISFKNRFIVSQEDNVLLNTFILGILFINVFSDFAPVTRLCYYFIVFQIILVPKLIYSFKNNNLKVLVLILVFIYYVLMLINALIVDISTDTSTGLIPYKNYFLKD